MIITKLIDLATAVLMVCGGIMCLFAAGTMISMIGGAS